MSGSALDALPPPTTHRPPGKQFRVIATRYPPIDFFERHVPAGMLDALWALEAQTNPRLREETGDLRRVAEVDRVSGPGASIVMAAFTHIGWPSRFSDGGHGVYYAGRSLETAIRETVHHRERIARQAALSATEFSLRAWVGTPRKPLHDLRAPVYAPLHDPAPDPADHPLAQAYGKALRAAGAWGLLYNSVRHPGGECIAALRPPAVSLPTQGAHLVYVWNGERITHVYEKSEPIIRFDPP
ncbi:MAG: RES family NAD+ phosphorylase [Thiotrichales bacterium]